MANSDLHGGERGFTLIEVLVALAIAALGVVAIFSAGSAGLQGVDLAARYVTATRDAEAHLAEVGTSIALADRELGGVDAGGFRWLVRMKPVASRATADEGTKRPVLYAVESLVMWQGNGAPRSVRLTTWRLGAPPAAERSP